MKIDSFQGKWRFLSNFWPAEVIYDGYVFPSVECAYQAAKCVRSEDRVPFKTMTSIEAKRAGRKVDMRSDWVEVKLEIMEMLLKQKFAEPGLREKLRATAPHELVEGNWWGDKFWGVCRGVGENHLGRLLMEIRG